MCSRDAKLWSFASEFNSIEEHSNTLSCVVVLARDLLSPRHRYGHSFDFKCYPVWFYFCNSRSQKLVFTVFKHIVERLLFSFLKLLKHYLLRSLCRDSSVPFWCYVDCNLVPFFRIRLNLLRISDRDFKVVVLHFFYHFFYKKDHRLIASFFKVNADFLLFVSVVFTVCSRNRLLYSIDNLVWLYVLFAADLVNRCDK